MNEKVYPIHTAEMELNDSEVSSLVLSSSDLKLLKKQCQVSCLTNIIRESHNYTIQNACLLLLANIAQLFPTQVFDHLLPIFTLMSSSVKRADDSYTMLVIEKTIKGVLPAVVSEDGVGVFRLLESFISNIDGIPSHRRTFVFSMILKTIHFK